MVDLSIVMLNYQRVTDNLSSAFPLGSQHLNGNIYRKYPSVQYLMDDFLWWKWGFSIAWLDYAKAIQSAHISSLNGFQWLEEANLGFLYGLFFDWNVKLQVCGCAPFLDKSIYTCHDCLNPAVLFDCNCHELAMSAMWILTTRYIRKNKPWIDPPVNWRMGLCNHLAVEIQKWGCELANRQCSSPLSSLILQSKLRQSSREIWTKNSSAAPLRLSHGLWHLAETGRRMQFQVSLVPRVSTWSGLNPLVQNEASNYRMFCDNLVW